jgi:hypothetical protein
MGDQGDLGFGGLRREEGNVAGGFAGRKRVKSARRYGLVVDQHVETIDPKAARRAEREVDADRVVRDRIAFVRRTDSNDRRERGGDGFRNLSSHRRVGLSDGLRLVSRLEHELDDVGAVVLRAELRRGKEVGLLIPTAIDVPADQILTPRGRHIIAARCPGDPFAGLRLDE